MRVVANNPKCFVFSSIETILVASVCISVAVAFNYLTYINGVRVGFFSCDTYAYFDEVVIDSNGKEYPAGTVFDVFFITNSGTIGMKTKNNDMYWHGDYNIEETANRNELETTLELIKNEIKDDYINHNIRAILLGVLIIVIIFPILNIINSHIIENKRAHTTLLLSIAVISSIVMLAVVVYLKLM